jgi:glycine/D-amino acid oxidase-like deaminating enzyme
VIAILGGGIAGCSLAWALTERGCRDVQVFDPHAFETGSTARATGGFRTQFISPLNVELSLASRPFFLKFGDEIAFRTNGYGYLATDKAFRTALDEWMRIQQAVGLPSKGSMRMSCFLRLRSRRLFGTTARSTGYLTLENCSGSSGSSLKAGVLSFGTATRRLRRRTRMSS